MQWLDKLSPLSINHNATQKPYRHEILKIFIEIAKFFALQVNKILEILSTKCFNVGKKLLTFIIGSCPHFTIVLTTPHSYSGYSYGHTIPAQDRTP
jgi:hypothetical protein